MITLRRAVLKHCPYRDETDAGELVIVLPGDAPELHALGGEIEAMCAEPVSHEEFTRAVAAILPEGAQVTTTWRTGPWSVEVSEAVISRAGLLREPEYASGAGRDA